MDSHSLLFVFDLFCLSVTVKNILCFDRGANIVLESDNMSGLLIDVPKHLCNMKYTVWEKMLDHIDYSEYKRFHSSGSEANRGDVRNPNPAYHINLP